MFIISFAIFSTFFSYLYKLILPTFQNQNQNPILKIETTFFQRLYSLQILLPKRQIDEIYCISIIAEATVLFSTSNRLIDYICHCLVCSFPLRNPYFTRSKKRINPVCIVAEMLF